MRGSAMRYQSVWLSRRKVTRPSSRILARCCDRADCDKPTAPARAVTLLSPHSTSWHRIISRRSLASARKMPATSTACFSKVAGSNVREAIGQPIIRAFFDEPTNTVSYLVVDPTTKKAAIIDPVFDYDHNSGEVDTRSVEAMLKAAEEAGYTIEWVLETH